MVSEFEQVRQTDPVPDFSLVLCALFRGWIASADIETGFQTMPDKIQSELVTISIHTAPQEFVQGALHIGHPREVNALFPSCFKEVVREIVCHRRTKRLRRVGLQNSEKVGNAGRRA